MGRGLVGWRAESARAGSAFRFKEPYFWEGTGNCQSAREGAHRRWVMSADQLLDNKEGVLQEKVAAAAAATAAPRSLGGEGQVGERRGDAAAAAAEGQGIERAVGGGSASQPRLLLLFLLLLQTRRVQPQRSLSRREHPEGREAAARPRAGQGPQPPWIATTKWWRRRWKVQAFLWGWGGGAEGSEGGRSGGLRPARRRAPRPPLSPTRVARCPAPAGASPPRPRRRERALRGEAQAGNWASPGWGAPGGHGCSIPPGHRLHLLSELRNLPRTLAFPLLGMEGGGCAGGHPPETRGLRGAPPPHPLLATPSPCPAASPFLPLTAATCGDRGRVRLGPPAQSTGPNLARGSSGPGGRSSEKMKSLQGNGRRSRPGA